MKVALFVNRIERSIEQNLNNIISNINHAADKDADLVVLSETALTGLVNVDIPEKDIKLGIEIPGYETEILCNLAKERSINIAMGVFEREDKFLYDSAIYINRTGIITLKYRRITKGWRILENDKSIYKEGENIPTYQSEFGKICFLICGDLFDEDLINKVALMNIDYLIFPFARSFPNGLCNQEKWEKEEMPYYIEPIKKIGATTIGVNYISKAYFGGAFIISKKGEICMNYPLGKEGVIIADL